MNRNDMEAQALQFIAWHRKRGQDWESDFATWSRSKGFGRRDCIRIRTIVVEELTSVGSAPVDIFDFLRPGAA